ncbi:phospholipase A(1) DAD1, chloroplastic-like [Phoenix dactylifera]|uniref:Phospholipase A(1) DAD1, chloroplastic-like n=1 Tax=Phoenix dactylifera TaxID=42345 RepID=A0A8B7CLK4_PHODC|nr:phospholipase A(1) DAD1, chloroplastic-like [Phoenix dactylifera]
MRVAIGATRHGSLPTARRRRSLITTCSTSSDSSKRCPSTVRIGRQWMEYQGANNWDGLLDPLDDTLRSEIVRYGEFVQAAYTCFDFDPSSPSYATCRFPRHSFLRRSGLPCTGYRVTRNLHATSGIRLPRWARAASTWLSRRSSWIGYVAVCQDEDEIARLGRRDIVVAFRGTATCLEWLENLRATLTHLPCPFPPSASQPEPMVQRGFWSLFTSPGSIRRCLRDEVRDEIARLLDAYGGKGQPLSLTVTGHSLGAALAVLTAYDITTTFQDAPMVTVVSFGGPRVGNASFCRRLEERGGKVLRIVNTQDIITKVPGFVIDDNNVKEEDSSEGVIPSWLLSKTGWVYADIGRELRVDGRRTANVVACHDLSVYLNLVNQLSAKCPFRSLATQAMAGQR